MRIVRFTLSLVLCCAVLARAEGPTVVVDAAPFGYAYAPAIIRSEGVWYMYFCSGGTGPLDWDHVRVVTSVDGQAWGQPVDLLQSTPRERANCDPSVVRADLGDGLYYLSLIHI